MVLPITRKYAKSLCDKFGKSAKKVCIEESAVCFQTKVKPKNSQPQGPLPKVWGSVWFGSGPDSGLWSCAFVASPSRLWRLCCLSTPATYPTPASKPKPKAPTTVDHNKNSSGCCRRVRARGKVYVVPPYWRLSWGFNKISCELSQLSGDWPNHI